MPRPAFKTPDDGLIRRAEVLAREDITVPAGTFHRIHLLTTGFDGNLSFRHNKE